jgi:lysophospholipase L1-like esterase
MPAPAVPIIMALGDSITQCRTSKACYRFHLYRRLVQQGIETRWVGSMRGLFVPTETSQNVSTGSPATSVHWPVTAQSHEGHWSWTAQQLHGGHERQRQRGKLGAWLRQLRRRAELPELVLLHIGTNDLTKYVLKEGAPVKRVVHSVQGLLTSLCHANPGVSVIVASPIPGCRGSREQIARRKAVEREYAERLHGLTSLGLHSCPRMRLAYVNMTNWVGCHQLHKDGLHPAAAGAQAMAAAWANALRGILPARSGYSVHARARADEPEAESKQYIVVAHRRKMRRRAKTLT